MNRRLYKNAKSAVALIWSSIIWDDEDVRRKRYDWGKVVVRYSMYCSGIWLHELFKIVHWDEEKWSCTYSPHMS